MVGELDSARLAGSVCSEISGKFLVLFLFFDIGILITVIYSIGRLLAY